MNIIGLSALYHDSACCLLQDGRLTAAAAEERFTRIKHDPRLPVSAFRYCLRAGGLRPADIDAVAYYETPAKKRQRQLQSALSERGVTVPFPDAGRPERLVREKLGYEGPFLCFDHHRSHAASAFFYSGFERAAVLTVDGVGEWATTSYGYGHHENLEIFEEVRFPHSLGLLYASVTGYLGFRVNSGEYKVMGLAPYGRPLYVDQIRTLVRSRAGGQFELDMRFFDFVRGETMFSPRLAELLGRPPRQADAPIEPFHEDVARSLQTVVEEILLEKVEYLAGRVDASDLCLAGGVALNAVANGRIRREGPFERLFVQPAAGDAGGCVGAAALAHIERTGRRHSTAPLSHVYLGPAATKGDLRSLLTATGIDAHDFSDRESELLDAVADRLAQNQIVGWVQGRMEFGPRALGARSILANPMEPTMRDRLNLHVKQRESFRPFAPAVLAAHAPEHFDLGQPAPFMLETCRVVSTLHLPAVTHVDGSARPQTVDAESHPRFAALLEAFLRRTGCPVLLNTSLNVRGEPIACTPVDALFVMIRADLDALVLGDFVVDKSMLADNLAELISGWETQARFAFSDRSSAVEESLYTLI